MSDFFFALSAIVCFLCAIAASLSAHRAEALRASVQARIRSLESRAESQDDFRSNTLTTLETLANRVKMQKVRNATDHVKAPSGEPDPYTQTEEWRKWMSKRLAEAKLGVKL